LVITLDDVDDIDLPTLLLIRDLFEREAIPRLALATTLPSYGTTRVVPREAPLHAQLDAQPLTLVGVRTWLRQTMNWEIPQPLLVWFYEQTGGRPAHIGRGLAVLAEQGILVQDAGGGWSGRAEYEAVPLHEHTGRPTIVPIHNAPATTLAFVGRNEEIAHLTQEIVAHRLLVLLGPGGTGKSRLAAQAAAECYRQFPDGVFFVSLVALDAPHLLMTAIADAIGISLHGPEEPETRVIGELADRRTLLVLDNFEPLLDAAPQLGQLLDGAPGVHLLVTSREPLNLSQAVVVDVGGMDYPGDETLEPLEAWDAVHLFLRSASRFFSDFVLVDEQRVFAARICRLVGGMPLAIELASAWVRTFSCEVIAKKIETNLGFLATDRPDIADRHRHLLAMVASFWFLLSAEEQRVLSRLSVFRGGFDGSAARKIAAASPFFLDGLVGKGYLRWQPDLFRYDIHELLRQYAHEQLVWMPDEQEEAETLHAAHYLHLVEQHEATLYQSETALRLIRQERENVRAAWTWAVQHADTERIARSIEGMSRFYDLAGLWQEGAVFEEAFTRLSGLLRQRRGSAQNPDGGTHEQIVVGRLLAVYGEFLSKQGKDTQAMPIAARVQEMGRTLAVPALVLAGTYLEGVCSWRLGMLEQAANALESALALARETQNEEREIDCLHRLGDVRFDQGEMAGAEQVLTIACSMSSARGDRFREARVLNLLGMLTERTTGCHDALALYHRALALQREFGSQSEIAVLLANIGATSLKRGMFLDADTTLSQAMRLYRASGNRPNLAVVMENLGQSALMQGDWAQARGYLEKAWAIGRELAQESAYVPAYLALLEHQQGNHEAARVLAVQAVAMAERTGNQGEEAEAQTSLAHALAALGADSDAQAAYERAVALHEQMGQMVMRAEPMAGLARLALARGEVDQAVAWVEEILALGELDGTLDPFRIWLTCTDGLIAAGKVERAREVRAEAATRLTQQAEQVQGGRRRMFFQVPSHRRLAGLMGLDE
jgi:tetratricopeptide (TPR) repeat protein